MGLEELSYPENTEIIRNREKQYIASQSGIHLTTVVAIGTAWKLISHGFFYDSFVYIGISVLIRRGWVILKGLFPPHASVICRNLSHLNKFGAR
jgi:hypothetical protein